MPGKKIKEAKELYYAYLRQNGLKKTRQKDLVLEAFLNTEGHLSVEDVYSLAKKKDKKVGIVTVFRTLKSLAACGIAKEIGLGDGLTRFEHSYRHPQHHHIVCTECHQAIEFISPELESIQEGIIDKYGFKPSLKRVQIYGICRDCLQEQPTTENVRYDTRKIFARDALKMALFMAMQGIDFFREAAARNRDPMGRKVFESLADAEEKHLAELESSLAEINRQQRGLDRAPIFLHFDLQKLRKLLPDLTAFEMQGQLELDARCALQVAMDLEERAARYFRDFADKFVETEGKWIFQQFADDEMKQLDSISRQASDLMSS